MPNTILGTIDQGGDGIDLLIALVNEIENKNYLVEEFVFTNPEVNTNGMFPRNSVIRMAPKATSGYYGVRFVYYNRINIAEVGPFVLTPAQASGATTIYDLLDTINSLYGILLKPTDVVNHPLPAPDINGNVSIDIETTATCVIFYSGTTIEIPPSINLDSTDNLQEGINNLYYTEDRVTNLFTPVLNTALSGKVDKITGKGLSSLSYETSERVKLAGLFNYVHPASGVTAGQYTKVTVDVNGHVTEGAALNETDIPALTWSKIATGKPTTLSGYGISDAVAQSVIGQPGGIPPLDITGKIDAAFLPPTSGGSGSGSVFVFNNITEFPVTGVTDALYISQYEEETYYWNGSAYRKLSNGTQTTVVTLDFAQIFSNSISIVSTGTLQQIDSFDKSAYTTAKYLLTAKNGVNDTHVHEIMVTHNGIVANILIYGEIKTGMNLVSYDIDVLSGEVRLLVTPTQQPLDIKLVRTLIG